MVHPLTRVWQKFAKNHQAQLPRLRHQHVHTALRLELNSAPSDPQEALLMAVLREGRSEGAMRLKKDLHALLRQGNYPPLDALVLLWQNVPELGHLLGQPDAVILKRLKRKKYAHLMHRLVPPDWHGEATHHVLKLIRSMEIWLKAIEITDQ